MRDGTAAARRPWRRTTVTHARDGNSARAAAFAFATVLPAVCVEATRGVLRRRFPRAPRTALVAAMTLGAAVGVVAGTLAIDTAFDGL
jgi:hypothetical protein